MAKTRKSLVKKDKNIGVMSPDKKSTLFYDFIISDIRSFKGVN